MKNAIKIPFRLAKKTYYSIKAYYSLKKTMNIKSSIDKIRVAFLVQMPEIWDKQLPIFEAMLNDDRFDPFLVVLPSFDLVTKKFDDYGEELKYFKDLYSLDNIIVAYEKEQWVDLKPLKFSYVFYPRCWENYIPNCYKARKVIKFSKTCYIPYCFHGLNVNKEYYSTSFFKFLYLFFCCSDEQFKEYPKRKYQKSVFLGFPSIEKIHCETQTCNNNILWTPRWTDDDEYGGSTFFQYMNSIPQIKETFPQVNLILRPHPLTFQNAIRLGKLTEAEIETYQSKLASLGICFDRNKLIEDSFSETDILITDFSSVLMPYFLTGKPIIYCAKIDHVEFTDSFRKIIECSYIARSWQDVMRIVSALLNGDDPLKKKRIETVRTMSENNKESTQRILRYLIKDSKM